MKTGRPIKFYRTNTEGLAPPVEDLQQGEIALNLFAGKEKIFVKNSDNQLASFACEQEIAKALSGLNLLIDTKADKIDVESNTKSINSLNTSIKNINKNVKNNTDLISSEKSRAEQQEALKLDKERFDGSNIVTSLSNIPINKRLVFANIGANSSLSLTNGLKNGEEVHIIIKNTSAGKLTIPIPNTGNYVSTGNDSIIIDSAKYGEINVISDGTKMYIRGL